MSELVRAWFEGWNAQDGESVAALFAEGGTYEGPTTRMAIHAYDLTLVIEALAAQFSDFTFETGAVIDDGTRVAVEWTLRGTNDGSVKTGVLATGRRLHVTGVDVIELRDGKISAVRRTYDRRAMMEQLGLQVIVEPFRQGKASYGYSLHASSSNPAVPGVIALTWIQGRDESERDRVRGHSGKIAARPRQAGFPHHWSVVRGMDECLEDPPSESLLVMSHVAVTGDRAHCRMTRELNQ